MTTNTDAPLEREQFEAWAKPDRAQSVRLPDGGYQDSGMQAAWNGWQARAALAVEQRGVQLPHVKYVPVNANLRDKNWRHPHDDEKCSPECQKALDARGDNEGQGLDGFWKWGFKAGWNAFASASPQAPAQRDREADRARFPDPAFNRWLDEGISDAGHTVWDQVGSVVDAWHGWNNRPFYAAPAAQAEQEPVAWRVPFEGHSRSAFTSGAPSQETVKYWRDQGIELEYAYASPQRAVEPMTDEQIESLRRKTFSTSNPYCPVDDKSMRKAIRAYEAARGITKEQP